MRTAKIRKILILVAVSFAALLCAFTSMTFFNANAVVSGSQFFTYKSLSTHADSEITVAESTINIPLEAGDSVFFSKTLIIEDFGVSFYIPESASEVSFAFATDSFDVNGNKKVEGNTTTYDTTINHTLKLVIDGSNVEATFAGGSAKTFTLGAEKLVNLHLYLDAANENLLVADVDIDGTTQTLNSSDAKYYKVEKIDKVIAKDIKFTVEATAATVLKVQSIDQKASDVSGKWKQTFVDSDDNGELDFYAYPRLTLSDAFFSSKKYGGDNTVLDGRMYTVTPTAYSISSTYTSASYTLKSVDADADYVRVGNVNSSSKKLTFNLTDTARDNDTYEMRGIEFVKVGATDVVFESYQVAVVNEGRDGRGNAPEYNMDADALESFTYKLNQALFTTYDVNGTSEKHYVRIGENQFLNLESTGEISMRSLVSDDTSSYENLNFKVVYKNATESTTYAGALKVPLKVAGAYEFYVIFTDESGNAMEEDDFYVVSDDGETKTYGVYEDYVFDFVIYDDAPIAVSAYSQSSGTKNVKYNATSFTINASAYTAEYKLFYSSNNIANDDSGWTEIIASANATDTEATYNGYTYDQIQQIGFNGSLSFTPDKVGYYKLQCIVHSTNAERSATASAIISVQSEPSSVYNPDTDWLRQNVWSVVFLSIGVLCLIGILVLLFIKPKEAVGENVKVVVRKKEKNNKK